MFTIGPVGSRLPLMMGSGFACIAVAVPLAQDYGLSAVLGGVLVTAAVQVAIALGIHKIAFLFPPVVTGTIILVIGLGLLPQVAAVLAAIPPAVLGAGVLVLFGMVCAIGVQLLSKEGLDTRALLVVALSVGLGRGDGLGSRRPRPGHRRLECALRL